MDELARRYLLLGLRLDRISPGFVDSYVGPPELAEIARGEPQPLAAELHDEALALQDLARALDGDGVAGDDRRLWFLGLLWGACSSASPPAAADSSLALCSGRVLRSPRIATAGPKRGGKPWLDRNHRRLANRSATSSRA